MVIPYNQEWFDNAVYEQKMRAPYMFTKFADNAARKAGQIRGLVVEHHVSGWFKLNFPKHYLEPNNYQKWTEICSHDFKLKFNSRTIFVDVSGPKKDGSFGSYDMKPKTGVDYHILCNPIGFESWDDVDFQKGFEVLGVLEPTKYTPSIQNSDIIDFEVWIKSIGL